MKPEKLKNKKKLINIIIIIIIIISIVLIILGILIYQKTKQTPQPVNYIETVKYSSDNTDYEGLNKYDKKVLKTYEEYQEFTNAYNIKSSLTPNDFDKENYIIVFAENDYCGGKINGIRKIKIQTNEIRIDIGYDGSCGPCPATYEMFIVPIDKAKINDDSKVSYNYIVENKYKCDPMVAYKPIIYLYPKEKTDITIKLLKEENLTTTYPKYKDKWKVIAYPNGNLIDKQTKRNQYGLYWEGTNNYSKEEKEGFIVRGKDTIKFLEKTLNKLGLSEREANEFIIYWLPKLEQNKYNYIHFASIETINNIMPLDVNPKPDTIIRVLMEYKPLDKPIKIKKQTIKKPQRKGFALVEWGGTQIKK